MIKNIASIPIFVSDQEKALTFYRDYLGFKVVNDISYKDNTVRWLTIALPNNNLELILFHPKMSETPDEQEQIAKRIGQWTGIILETDDIQNDYQSLKEKGVNFQEEPSQQFWGGWNVSFADPDGNIFQLIQPK
ncbi:MAG: VOC family protein [Crocosphaera sp.]